MKAWQAGFVVAIIRIATVLSRRVSLQQHVYWREEVAGTDLLVNERQCVPGTCLSHTSGMDGHCSRAAASLNILLLWLQGSDSLWSGNSKRTLLSHVTASYVEIGVLQELLI